MQFFGQTPASLAKLTPIAAIATGLTLLYGYGTHGTGPVMRATQANQEAMISGTHATGTTICPENPVAGDTITVGGSGDVYTVYRLLPDAGVLPAQAIDCTGSHCLTTTDTCAQLAAAIASNGSSTVLAGVDGGVLYLGSKDAGMAANRPISAVLQTRITATVTSTVTNTDTDSNTSTGTATATATTTNTVTSAGTSTGMSGGRDPVLSGGPVSGGVANTFDPSVSGLAAPMGSRVCTADDTGCWFKTGSAATAWTTFTALPVLAAKLLNASGVQQTVYTLGSEARTWDITGLAGDTRGGFELACHLIGGTGTNGRYVSLRVNGATTDLAFYNWWFSAGTHAIDTTNEIGALGAPGDVAEIILSVRFPSSSLSSRIIEIASGSHYSAPGATKAVWRGNALFTGAGELTSLGLSIASGGPTFAATSQCILTRTTQLPLAP